MDFASFEWSKKHRARTFDHSQVLCSCNAAGFVCRSGSTWHRSECFVEAHSVYHAWVCFVWHGVVCSNVYVDDFLLQSHLFVVAMHPEFGAHTHAVEKHRNEHVSARATGTKKCMNNITRASSRARWIGEHAKISSSYILGKERSKPKTHEQNDANICIDWEHKNDLVAFAEPIAANQ